MSALDLEAFHSSKFTDEGILNAIAVAKTGGRVNIDENTTEEERLLRLINTIQQNLFSSGMLYIRCEMKRVLGL